jgi:hypothetical protein
VLTPLVIWHCSSTNSGTGREDYPTYNSTYHHPTQWSWQLDAMEQLRSNGVDTSGDLALFKY